MSIEKTWIIEQMSCTPVPNSTDCVVATIAWRLNATDGTHSVTRYGSVGVTYKEGDPYTPFSELTQATVIGWVKEALGAEQVASLEAGSDSEIEKLITPVVVTPALPWATTLV